MTPMDNIIFGFACALLGATIAIAGSYLVGARLAHNHARIIAGMRLREAFAPEVVKLQHLEDDEFIKIPSILEAAFERHHLAGNEFGFFLTKDEATSFIKAWREYCADADSNGKKTDFDQYMIDRDLAIDRIYAILKFTKT